MKYRRKKKPAVSEEDRRFGQPHHGHPAETGGTDLEGFLGHGGTKRASTGEKLSDLEIAMDDAGRRGRSGDWDEAKGRTFVGVYALCFQMVYGKIPLPLTEKAEVARGARIAMNCLHKHFADDKDAMVEFVKWTWGREKRKHTWALGQGVERKPMGVGLQFAASLVQEYWIYSRSGRRGR